MSLSNDIPHVQLGAGILEIDQPIVMCSGTSLVGAGKQTTIIKPSANFVGEALIINDPPPSGENFCRHITLRDFTLETDDRAVSGISFDRVAEVSVDRVEVEKCDYGVKLRDSITLQFNMCRMQNCNIGFSGINRITTLVIQSTRIRANLQHNVEIDGPGTFGIQFLQCIIEASSPVTRDKPGLIVGENAGDVRAFNALGSYFESNFSGTRAQIEFGGNAGSASSQGVFVGCFITAAIPNRADYAVHLKNCRSTTFVACNMSAHDISSFLIEPESGLCGVVECQHDVALAAGSGQFGYQIENGGFISSGQGYRADIVANERYGNRVGNTILATGGFVGVEGPLLIGQNPIGQIKGLSGTDRVAANLRGSIALVSGSGDVAFTLNEHDADYNLQLTGDVAESFAVTNKASNGFSITSSNPCSAANVDWLLVR